MSIGGGFAGLCAAVRGAELGLRTAVLEKGADERYLCSSRWAGGIFHVSYHDIRLDPARAGRVRSSGQTRGEAEPELAAAIAEDCARTVDWLASQGAQFRQRQPDQLAPLDAGAAARRGRGPGLAGPRPGFDDHPIAAAARSTSGADASRHPRQQPADGRRALRRSHRVARGADVSLSARAVVIADGGFPGRPRVVPPAYRTAPRSGAAAPRRQRAWRRTAHGARRRAPQ